MDKYNKGSLFPSSLDISSLNIGQRHGLARRCAAQGLRRRGTDVVSPGGAELRQRRLAQDRRGAVMAGVGLDEVVAG
jgi:hypothetical protein